MTGEELDALFARFRFYRASPTKEEIAAWLSRFSEADQPVAEKALRETVLVSEAVIQRGYKEALEAIPGWSKSPARREGKWVIAGFGGPGASGNDMLRKFREANRLSADRYNDLFSTVTELADLELTADDTVIFVDDFSGTGEQIAELWPVHAEMAGGGKVLFDLDGHHIVGARPDRCS